MGVVDVQLPPNRWAYKTVKWIASSLPGSWFLSHSLHHLDRVVVKLTGGRTAPTTMFTGLPVLTLTTRGAKTGQPRAIPLIGVPVETGLILIASNWGRKAHPAWYWNVRADPSVTLSVRGCVSEYTAQETQGELRAQCWASAVELYPGYAAYERRAGTRRIPVILLTPKSA